MKEKAALLYCCIINIMLNNNLPYKPILLLQEPLPSLARRHKSHKKLICTNMPNMVQKKRLCPSTTFPIKYLKPLLNTLLQDPLQVSQAFLHHLIILDLGSSFKIRLGNGKLCTRLIFDRLTFSSVSG